MAGWPQIDMLPAVVEATGKTPVLFDSESVRSGSDVAKALALGATAVGVGRPYVYGLARGRARRRTHVLGELLAEADLLMAVDGYPDIAALKAAGAVRPELIPERRKARDPKRSRAFRGAPRCLGVAD